VAAPVTAVAVAGLIAVGKGPATPAVAEAAGVVAVLGAAAAVATESTTQTKHSVQCTSHAKL
jgi:hypothetical protein